jgi:hypothetical protein
MTKIDFKLTEEEQEALESSSYYIPFTRGRVSGATAAVRSILREVLGLPPAVDIHQRQSAALKGKPMGPRSKK